MIKVRLAFAVVMLSSLAGCATSKSSAPGTPSVAPGPKPAQLQRPADAAVVRVDESIRSACGLSQSEAYFAFDSAELTTRDSSFVDRLTRCFIDGPLAGRSMKVVGHADPRGEEEYNLALGGRRADSFQHAVTRRGLPRERVSTTSRGEYEASGSDEASWALDRRVDVLLGEDG